MNMKIKTILKDQGGGSVVEFAIVLPLLIVLLFGIIEMSLLLYNQHVLTNATREGARLGIIVQIPRVTNQDIKDQIKTFAQNYLITFGSDTLTDANIEIAAQDDGDDTNGACTSLNPDPATDERCLTFGSDLKIIVTYNYDFLLLFKLLGFSPKTIRAVTTMRME